MNATRTLIHRNARVLSQLVMNVPFTAIYFSTYESAKKLLNQADREEGLLTQLTAGGVAGAVLLSVCRWCSDLARF